jgi:hypothetical protein
MTEMGTPGFIADLAERGRVRLSAAAAMRGVETGDALDADLCTLDAVARAEMAFDAPPMALAPARWAAALLFDACRFLVVREFGPEVIAESFARRCPQPPSPSVCFSVDLVMRYLPGVISLARGLAEDDPLLVKLMETAREWPLSSVGVAGAGAGAGDVAPFIDHRGLRQLYVDRIIETRDLSRLGDPRVRHAVREALGGFAASLAPDLAAALDNYDQEQPV